jgi:hypothetical protein
VLQGTLNSSLDTIQLAESWVTLTPINTEALRKGQFPSTPTRLRNAFAVSHSGIAGADLIGALLRSGRRCTTDVDRLSDFLLGKPHGDTSNLKRSSVLVVYGVAWMTQVWGISPKASYADFIAFCAHLA